MAWKGKTTRGNFDEGEEEHGGGGVVGVAGAAGRKAYPDHESTMKTGSQGWDGDGDRDEKNKDDY